MVVDTGQNTSMSVPVYFGFNIQWCKQNQILKTKTKTKLEFGMYPQSMPTEWTHARTLRPWQSVRLDLW